MNAIRVGNRLIGTGQPCFLVAEIGINHNGDMNLARQMIHAAVAAGADAVKFQNYRTKDFLTDRSLTYTYKRGGKSITEFQYDMFRRCELSSVQLRDLAGYCRKLKITFFSTPTSDRGIRDLQRLRVPLMKNGSDYLGNLPLIRSMAKTAIPTVLSTGMATLAEIDEAVRAFRESGGRDLVLLHCISSYPTPPADVHLRKISALAAAFGCLVGFSDHTEGMVAALGAVALGACFFEKHFTSDRTLPGPDQELSSDPAEFAALVSNIRTLEKCMGQSVLGPAASEGKNRQDCRLSCVAARSLQAGHRLTLHDLSFQKPGLGLPPAAMHWLLGLRLHHDVLRGHVLLPADFR